MFGSEFPDSEFDSNSLGFRAACNEGAPSGRRPVNVRVLSRIGADRQAKEIADRVWRNLRPASWELNLAPSTQSAETDLRMEEQDRLFVAWKALSEDLAWKTLVLEKIIEERQWRDSWKMITRKPFEGVKSLIEKFWSKENPGTRSAGIALATLLTLVAGHSAIRLVADPGLTKDLHWLGSVPLTMDTPTSAQLPHFSIDTTGLASQLPAISINPNAPNLKLANSTLNLKDANGLLKRICCERDENVQIAQELHEISSKLAGGPADKLAMVQANGGIEQYEIDRHERSTPLPELSESTLLGEMRNQTHEYQRQNSEITDELEQMKKQVEALEGQLTEARNQTHEFQAQNASLRNSLRMGSFSSHLTFSGSGDVQSVSFPVMTADGLVKLVPLKVDLVSSSGSGSRAFALVNVVSTDSGKTLFNGQIDEGSAKLIGSLNATLMLNSVEHRWLVLHTVRVTITPN